MFAAKPGMMNNYKRIITILSVLFLLACSTSKKGSDYDESANFEAYKTYAFSKETLKVGIMTLDKQKIISAIEKEMSKLGFEKSNNPDVLIDMVFNANKIVDATKTKVAGNPWRYRYWSSYSANDTYYNKYSVGTINVGMVDNASQQMVWFSSSTKSLPENASVSKVNSTINQAVKNIFKTYPKLK